MVRLAQGQRDAFDVVFDGLWPHVLWFVARAMPGHPDAEDVAQQTLLKVFSRISDFDTGRDGVAWSFGIAGYEVKTLRRQMLRRREVPADQAAGRITNAPTPEDAAIDRDLRGALMETLGALAEADRNILLDMHVIDVSPAASRKRRQRALDRLRAAWRARHV